MIADPDAESKAAGDGDQTNEEVVVSSTTQVTESAAPVIINNSRPEEPAVATTSVEVEVAKGSQVPAQPQHAEEVKLKKKKCCTIV